PVVPPAPISSCQKRPSNFNLRFFRVVTMKPGGSDDLLSLLIYDYKGPAAVYRLFEEGLKYIFFVAIALRMLFPDERIGRNGKQIVPIIGPERAKLNEFAF